MRSAKSLIAPLVVGASLFAGSSATLAQAGSDDCSFQAEQPRVIIYRHNVSCAKAKQILRGLREDGNHAFVPMACGGPREVDGWRMENKQREWDSAASRYWRGRVSFWFVRPQNSKNPTCPVPKNYVADEPDA